MAQLIVGSMNLIPSSIVVHNIDESAVDSADMFHSKWNINNMNNMLLASFCQRCDPSLTTDQKTDNKIKPMDRTQERLDLLMTVFYLPMVYLSTAAVIYFLLVFILMQLLEKIPWEGEFILRSVPWAGLIASCGSFISYGLYFYYSRRNAFINPRNASNELMSL